MIPNKSPTTQTCSLTALKSVSVVLGVYYYSRTVEPTSITITNNNN